MMPSALTETITQNSNIFFFISKKKIQTKHIKQKFLLQNIKSKTRIHCMASYHINRTFKAFGDKIFTIICSKHKLHNL